MTTTVLNDYEAQLPNGSTAKAMRVVTYERRQSHGQDERWHMIGHIDFSVGNKPLFHQPGVAPEVFILDDGSNVTITLSPVPTAPPIACSRAELIAMGAVIPLASPPKSGEIRPR